jgi:hypothetical protein
MNPELLSSLAAEHRRDLAVASTARSVSSAGTVPVVPSPRASRPSPRLALPRYRVSWTRTSLAAVAGNRRARSLVIVISATRTL